MDIKDIQNRYDLRHWWDGCTLGSSQVSYLGSDIIEQILNEQNTERKDFFSGWLTPSQAEIYNKVSSTFPTLSQFISLSNTDERFKKYNLGRYPRDLDGYLSLLKEHKPETYKFFFAWFEPQFSEKALSCHKIITGRSGSGKSEIAKTLIFNHIEKKNCAVVVIEPHGDLAQQVYKSKIFTSVKQAQRLVIIDSELDENRSPIINIFDQFKPQNEYELDRISQEYTRTFATIFTDEGAEMTSRMETILGHCIRVILRRQSSSIWDLLDFMTAGKNESLIRLGASDPNPATQQFFANGDFMNEAYKSTKIGIYDRLQGLLQNQIFAGLTTGASTINLQKCIDSKKILVFNLSKGKLGTYASKAFGRLVISIIQVIGLQRANINENHRVPTHIVIDEFQNYVSDTLTEFLNEFRKYKMFLTLASQYIGQDLSTNATKSVLGNTEMKIVAQSSNDNASKMAKEMNISTDQIRELQRGEYYVLYTNQKTGVPTTIKLKGTTKYLGNSNIMSNTAFHGIKNEQILSFYTERSKYTPQITNVPQNARIEENKANFEPKPNRKTEQAPKFDLDV